MLTKCVFMQSLEGELLARVNRDCYFDHTFHKTHVHTEPQKAYIQTKYIKKKKSNQTNPTYIPPKEFPNNVLTSTTHSKFLF